MRFSTLSAVAFVAAGGLLSACGLNQEGVRPFHDTISFPGSALVDPQSGNWLYVANSNSDLRYNDGTLVAVDLRKIDPVREGGAWAPCPEVGYVHPRSNTEGNFCCWDQLDRTVLNCDERQFVEAEATVRIGSFAAGMVWQDTCPPGGTMTMRPCQRGEVGACDDPSVPAGGRLFLGVRGNSSITYIDVKHDGAAGGKPVGFSCGGTDLDFPECDDAHRLMSTEQGIGAGSPTNPDATPLVLPDEPYALVLDPKRDLLYVGHLRGDRTRPGTGGISLFDVSADAPAFVGPFGSIFPPDGNGLMGVTSLSMPGFRGNDSQVFVTSRYLPRVGSVIPTNVDACGQTTQSAVLSTGDAFETTLAGAETRGIAFVPDIQRAYVLQRVPPALVGFDLGQDAAGAMRFMPSEIIETCSSPTFLQPHDAAGVGMRLYVTCFETGQVYVVDPYLGRVTNTMDVGRGPAGLVFAAGRGQDPAKDIGIGTRAFVVGFGDNNISVLDLEPGSPTEHHVIMRIGFPSTVPR